MPTVVLFQGEDSADPMDDWVRQECDACGEFGWTSKNQAAMRDVVTFNCTLCYWWLSAEWSGFEPGGPGERDAEADDHR